ncbi:hypothetical protein [Blastococcus sp. TF02-8]|uniref:hypothetical protein n=1 Tax=Blastococcus sp. TF02-8 TaxID=2250574 RepID=UPI0011BEDA6C|nr:hypothetical protein [Blastococcus sp. TF02-8]
MEHVAWSKKVPEQLHWVLQELLGEFDEARGPIDMLSRYLKVPAPNLYDVNGPQWVHEQLARLAPQRVYELVEHLERGRSHHDELVSKSLAEEGVPLRMLAGSFVPVDQAATELDVDDSLSQPDSLLHGRFSPTKQQWDVSRRELLAGHHESAVAAAVNALESAVRIAADAKSISEGARTLFKGHRAPLGAALSQLHNYGSAMPNVRHGGQVASTMTRTEATAVCRAAAVFIVMVVNLDNEGVLPLTS